MNDFLPFFTLDGSVGLYSTIDDDIYHSVYGALSEANDKFVLPIDFYNYFTNKNDINILDICYGIGYNSKSFLNYFIKNFLLKKNNKKSFLTVYNELIHTDNILTLTKSGKYNESIYTNNIFNKYFKKLNINENFLSVSFDFLNNSNQLNIQNKDKDTNKNELIKSPLLDNQGNNNHKNIINNKYENITVNIDAVDTDKTLMILSPFFKSNEKLFMREKTGIKKIDKYLSSNNKLDKRYLLSKNVSAILVKNIIDEFGYESVHEICKNFLSKPKNRKFIDQNMLNFAKFYSKNRYKLSKEENNLAFLHNIYYQYLSFRYKKHMDIIENANVNIKYHPNDARQIVLSSNKKYDIVFLDGFTPSKCPSLWTYDFLNCLYSKLSDNGIVITYTSSAAVRNAFIKSNFFVGKIFNVNENKFMGTVAAKNKKSIIYELSKFDLDLINTTAGIVYRDLSLTSSNSEIISARNADIKNSNLLSSTKYLKEHKNEI